MNGVGAEVGLRPRRLVCEPGISLMEYRPLKPSTSLQLFQINKLKAMLSQVHLGARGGGHLARHISSHSTQYYCRTSHYTVHPYTYIS